jgi:hypothetical protein
MGRRIDQRNIQRGGCAAGTVAEDDSQELMDAINHANTRLIEGAEARSIGYVDVYAWIYDPDRYDNNGNLVIGDLVIDPFARAGAEDLVAQGALGLPSDSQGNFPGPTHAEKFGADIYGHPNTPPSGLIANEVLAAMNQYYETDIPLLTDKEIMILTGHNYGESTNNEITGITIDLTSNPQPGEVFRLTTHTVSSEGVSLDFRYYSRASYSWPDWGDSRWEVVQDWSSANWVEYSFSGPDSYYVSVHVVPQGEDSWGFGDPQGGFSVSVGGTIQITGITSDVTGTLHPGETVRVTIDAVGMIPGVPLNYRFFSRVGYGLDSETWGGNKWTIVQDWSQQNWVNYMFTAPGNYYLVGHIVPEGESWEFGDAQGGFNVTVE